MKVVKADKDLKNGAKAAKPAGTSATGQSAQTSGAPADKSNKDTGKAN